MTKIAIATCAAFPQLGPYDAAIVAAFERKGVTATPVVWTDPDVEWPAFDAVVVHSTWDSHIEPERFVAWLQQTARTCLLLNPAPLIVWNLHKGYLRALEERSIPVTPTIWTHRGEPIDLGVLMEATRWERAVVKPAVSANAHETHIVSEHALETAQRILDRLTADHDLMIQPYLQAFETEGERSYIFFDGVFSHAVRRPPTLQGAIRGFAGPVAIEPPASELQLARSVIEALGDHPLHARVDLATNNDGVVRLQELELVEPCLFTSLVPGAADRFALAVTDRVKSEAPGRASPLPVHWPANCS